MNASLSAAQKANENNNVTQSIIARIISQNARELEIVENSITKLFDSNAKQLTDISNYLLSLGGKRIRPIFALLVAKTFGPKSVSEELYSAATGIELIHMATLLHDDIIDQAPMRRKKASAFAKYGLADTLLTGDFLLVKAFGLCAKLSKYIVTKTEDACVALTEGEILEGRLTSSNPFSLEHYLDVADKKTASLFALSAGVGAFCAGLPEKQVSQMESFGRSSGLVFQMIDDILDITAKEDLLGKPVGTDLRQQTPSLLNVLWLESGSKEASDYFSLQEPTIEDWKKACDDLSSSWAISEAKKLAVQQIEDAKNTLAELESYVNDRESLEQLKGILDFTLERTL